MYWHSPFCGPACSKNAHKEVVDGSSDRKKCLHAKGGRPIQSITLERYSCHIYFLFDIVIKYQILACVISTWNHSRLSSWNWEAWYECLKNRIVQKKTSRSQKDLKTSYSGKPTINKHHKKSFTGTYCHLFTVQTNLSQAPQGSDIIWTAVKRKWRLYIGDAVLPSVHGFFWAQRFTDGSICKKT